jgi:hypothetical protein
MNNWLSFSSTKLDLFSKEGVRLKSASGFVLEVGNQYYLITNWHVVSGRDISARDVHQPALEPYTVRTALQTYVTGEENDLFSRGLWNKITIQLYDDNNAPTWREGQANQRKQPLVDVVALPIPWARTFASELSRDAEMRKGLSGQIPKGMMGPWTNLTPEPLLWGKIRAIPLSAIDTDVKYGPPDMVYIIGYPHAWAPAGPDRTSAAFWRTSSIASEINEPGMIHESGFFVDPAAPEGMTGSPVIGMKDNRLKLLGVYSDRSTAEFGAHAGLVWDACLIKELLRGS